MANHFLSKYSDSNDISVKPLSKDTESELRRYDWPGNVRELENNMHRAVLLATGEEIVPDDIMFGQDGLRAASGGPAIGEAATAGQGQLVGRTVADVERDLIIDTVQHCLGNRTHAANILGISIRTLRNKLKLYDSEGVAVPPITADVRMAEA